MPAILDSKSSPVKDKTSADQRSPWYKHTGILAIAIFLCANLLIFAIAGPDKGPKDGWGGAGSIDLAVKDFQAMKKAPNVVLLGSSLVMYPFWAMDKAIYPEVGDIFHHHGSQVLESKLKAVGLEKPSVYSFAVFGQMVSDAYIYVNEYLKQEKKPLILVYGIAPRDFADNDLSAITATHTFKKLVGLQNFAQYSDLYLPRLQEKLDFLFGHSVYLYGRRWRLQQETNRAIDKTYDLAGVVKPPDIKLTDEEKKAGFSLLGREDIRWANSEKEYRRRYRGIGDRDLSISMGFLSRLLDTCKGRDIQVLVVNMPLSDNNRALFPPGFYERFRHQVKDISLKSGARFVDAGNAKGYLRCDWWDSAHLGVGGGHKLVDELMPTLKEMLAGTNPNNP